MITGLQIDLFDPMKHFSTYVPHLAVSLFPNLILRRGALHMADSIEVTQRWFTEGRTGAFRPPSLSES